MVILVRAISVLLYLGDPAGMGVTVDAPLDEYDASASRLAAQMLAADASSDVRSVVRSAYPGASGELSDAIVATFTLWAATGKQP